MNDKIANYVIPGLIGLVLVGFLRWRQGPGVKSSMQDEKRRVKRRRKLYRDPSTLNDDSLDEVDKKFKAIVIYLIRSKDISLHNIPSFMSRFITTLTIRHGDEEEVMTRSPRSEQQLLGLIEKYGLIAEFYIMIDHNEYTQIVNKYLGGNTRTVRSSKVVYRRNRDTTIG